MVTWDDFDKIWARTSPLTPYEFSDPNYSQGWNFVGSTPPARQMWDSIQKKNDEKFKYLRDNFGTPNIVTDSSDMTDTSKIYVYLGSEVGWTNGDWYYYDEGTSSWVSGGVYNSVAFVTDTTLSIAGQPADAKATGDALALKADLAGCTFTGNVNVSADLSVTGTSTLANLSVSGTTALTGTSTAPTPSADDNSTKIATTEYVQNEVKPIETDVDISDKRISNIEKLLQGNLYDYQTDNTSAYTKSVPAGAMPYAGIEQIGGKTVVWNQLCGNVTMPSGVTYTDGGIYSINATFSGSMYSKLCNADKIIVGHKYYLSIKRSANTPKIFLYDNYHGVFLKTVASDLFAEGIATNESQCEGLYLRFEAGTYNAVVTCKCIDLTLAFGAGNEPTIEQIHAMFPAESYPYNEGTLLSAGVTEVVSKGKNLINEANVYSFTKMQYEGGVFTNTATDNKTTFSLVLQYLENGSYRGNVAEQQATTIGINSVTFTATVSCNQLSVGHNGSAQDLELAFYADIVAGKTYTLSINVISNIANQVGGIQFDDVMLEESATVTNYAPYMTPIQYPIPAEIQALEGYGWSAGSVYNYIDYERKVFVQNVAKKDISASDISLVTVTTYTNITYYQVSKPSNYSGYHKYADTKTSCPAINNRFISINRPPSYDTTDNINCIDGTADRDMFWFVFAKETTLAQAQNVLAGTSIYYELATPVETDISAYITDDNLINVEAGGTLTFPNSNGTDYQIPVPSEEEYMIDLQEAINNG